MNRGFASLLSALVLACVALMVPASSDAQSFRGVNPGVGDLGFLMATIPINIVLEATPPVAHERPTRSRCLSLTDDPNARTGLDCRVRNRWGWSNPQHAATFSDALLIGWISLPLWGPAAGQLGGGRERGIAEGTLVGVEALAATYLVTGLVKHVVRRQRPSVTHSEYGSFFSGHTSMAFASATMLTVYAYEYPWGSSRNRWTVPATAYTLAALTGYLRLGARRHWFSDVLVGALVGTGTSLVVHSVR